MKTDILYIIIITQVIIEIHALSLAENGVIFCYNHSAKDNFSKWPPCASPRFVDMKENAIPRNTKHATKFGMTLFKVKM